MPASLTDQRQPRWFYSCDLRTCPCCYRQINDSDTGHQPVHDRYRPLSQVQPFEYCERCCNDDSLVERIGDRLFRVPEYEDEEEDSESDGHNSDGLDEYGTGGDRCHKIGRSITGLQDCGFELEFLDTGYKDEHDAAVYIKDKHKKYVASVESDGSLNDYGAEVVSHYGPIDAISEGLSAVTRTLRGRSATSHNTKCCGLHVSISRDDVSTYSIARYVVFWNSEKNKQFLESFARRWDTGYCKPKAEKGRMPEKEEEHSLLIFNGDRYELVNLQNKHRIEVRAFRGTTKESTALACLSLSVWLMAYCQGKGPLTYQEFLEWCKTASFKRGDTVFTPSLIQEYWDSAQERQRERDAERARRLAERNASLDNDEQPEETENPF